MIACWKKIFFPIVEKNLLLKKRIEWFLPDSQLQRYNFFAAIPKTRTLTPQLTKAEANKK